MVVGAAVLVVATMVVGGTVVVVAGMAAPVVKTLTRSTLTAPTFPVNKRNSTVRAPPVRVRGMSMVCHELQPPVVGKLMVLINAPSTNRPRVTPVWGVA